VEGVVKSEKPVPRGVTGGLVLAGNSKRASLKNQVLLLLGLNISKFRYLVMAKGPKGVFDGVFGGSAFLTYRVLLLLSPIISKFR